MFIELDSGLTIEIKDCSGKTIDPSYQPKLENDEKLVRYLYTDGTPGKATREGEGHFYIEKTCIENRLKSKNHTNVFSNAHSKARRLERAAAKKSGKSE